jgi:hypothetical protein
VRELRVHVERMKADVGCDASGAPGANRRPVGLAANPTPLSTFNDAHPYYAAEYDLNDAG